MIEIDAAAGTRFGWVSGHSNRFERDRWRVDFAGGAVYPVVIADLARLRADLDGEFDRLQSLLTA